jgi:hypothetical protein
MDITTKHTKSTKEENTFLSDSMSSPHPVFVSFATFVVRKLFDRPGIRDNRPPGKLAQAEKTLKYSIRRDRRSFIQELGASAFKTVADPSFGGSAVQSRSPASQESLKT